MLKEANEGLLSRSAKNMLFYSVGLTAKEVLLEVQPINGTSSTAVPLNSPKSMGLEGCKTLKFNADIMLNFFQLWLVCESRILLTGNHSYPGILQQCWLAGSVA